MTEVVPVLRMNIANRIDDLEPGLSTMETFLADQSIGPDDRAQMMIILDEIASNVIKAAWPTHEAHSFEIALMLDTTPSHRQIVLVCTDDGVAFDPTQMPPPDLDADIDEREIGGLGLFLVGELSESMQYCRIDGLNRLTVVKKIGLVES